MKNIFKLIVLVLTGPVANASDIKETILTSTDADNRYASYSPNGQQILFESDRDGQWDIYLMNSDGTNQRRLTVSDSADRRPSWHPEGKMILFESNRSGEFTLYNMEIESREVDAIDLEIDDGQPMFARYSPDGSFIAFALKHSDQHAEIIIVTQDGSFEKKLTNYGFRTFYPNWSPDGESLVFFSRHETNNEDDEIYTISVAGDGKARLTKWPKHNFCPSWSNSGEKIAYVTSMEGSRPEIYVMDADGQNAQRITYNEDGDTLPQWAPDETRLLITGYRNGHYQICELTLD